MRVLIVDNDSEMLEATARALRDGFSIDVVTGKADALDLLRQNDFHVVVACERLNDGSGLDLLSQTAKRWPGTIRLFSATADRLALLRGRLGPFKLFQTLDYPINPGQLGSVLMLAQAAQAADADTTTIQHIVMGESGSSEVDAPAQTVAAMPLHGLAGGRASPRALPFSVPTVNPPPDVPAARRKPVTRESLANARHPGVPARQAPSHSTGAGFAPPASATQRSRILERAERTPLIQPRDAVTGEVPALSLTATNLRPMPEGIGAYRAQLMIGGAAAVVLLALGVGIYVSSGDSESPGPAAPASAATAPAAEASRSAADRIVAEIETALTQDDTRRAKAALARLRGRHPDHPRLAFFNAILSRRDAPQRASVRPARETARAEEQAAPALAQTGDAAQPLPVAAPSLDDPAGSAEAPPSAPQASASAEREPSPPAAANPLATPSSFAGRTLETTDATGASPAPAAPPAAAPAESAPARRGSTDPAGMPPVVREAKLVRRLPPEYPADAARSGKQGSVEISFRVTPDGRVAEPVIVSSSDRVFERAALAAVRRWRYDPRIEDGKPVEWPTTVRIEFQLSNKE